MEYHPSLLLGVVAIEKEAHGLPLTKVANLYLQEELKGKNSPMCPNSKKYTHSILWITICEGV